MAATGRGRPPARTAAANERADLYQRLLPRPVKNQKGETVAEPIRRAATQGSGRNWQKIQMTMTNLSFRRDGKNWSARSDRALFPGFARERDFYHPVDDQLRVYPNGPLAAHVLASWERETCAATTFRNSRARRPWKLILNPALSGVAGWRVTQTDVRSASWSRCAMKTCRPATA